MNESRDDKDSPVITYFKGISMGLADLVPGVSGGTIALIMGIYERLISAIRSIDLKFLLYIFKGVLDKKYLKKAEKNFLSIDFKFLVPLASGIATAILGAFRLMMFLRKHYPAHINAFFFGLILVSAVLVYDRIKDRNFKTFLPGFLGFIFAFLYTGIEQVTSIHTLPIIFLSGFLAICAMILPGISGAFILIFLGQYDYMLSVLQSILQNWFIILVFLLGVVISLFSFSRLLSHMLNNYRSKTLFFLTGLMIGALRSPFTKIVKVPGILSTPSMLLGSILSGLAGVLLLVLLERKRRKPR
ncbi:hypothetical protein AKJ51_04260 [candidate division MSBL1 archaeon SCGC-AAA382A20]|uniref:DUF368 domain-containing protein n=1 Tax=candidate division MSBL1 archaeon SCGC-AAA382A20 TaxID=1698280 RepID=A0A133VHZ4_9EURY|nr:hypothetical protein AKJ51_04260 [candidate division MSBL1 archaeon SCGC-AAA382A20]